MMEEDCVYRGILNNFMSKHKGNLVRKRIRGSSGWIQSPECGLYYFSLLLVSHLTPVFHSIECSTSGEYIRPLNTVTDIVLNEPFVALYSFFGGGVLALAI